MWSGTPCAVIISGCEALLSIQTSYTSHGSPISTPLLGCSAGAGGEKNNWPEADEVLTCVLGGRNIVLHKYICVLTALMRRGGGGTHRAVLSVGSLLSSSYTADCSLDPVTISLHAG